MALPLPLAPVLVLVMMLVVVVARLGGAAAVQKPLRLPRSRLRRAPPLPELLLPRRRQRLLKLLRRQRLVQRLQALQLQHRQQRRRGAASRCRQFSLPLPPSQPQSTGSAKPRRWWLRSELQPLQQGLMRTTMARRRRRTTTSSTSAPSAAPQLQQPQPLPPLLLLVLRLVDQPLRCGRLHLHRLPRKLAPRAQQLLQARLQDLPRLPPPLLLLRLPVAQPRPWPSSK